MSLHGKRKEIYKYEAPWTVYAMNWSVRPDKRFRLALGSFVEEYNNKVNSCATLFCVPVPAVNLAYEETLRLFVCAQNNNETMSFLPSRTLRAGGGRDMFASVGADGSVRMFDLRHLEHSTIIYEDPQHHPLLRLCWNKQDPNYLATMAMDGMEVVILDVRVPCTPVARLNNHRACVNGIAWAPHSSCHICTAADDHQALIWDIQQMPRAIEDPILAYTAEGEINNVQWASTQPDWIAICYNNCLEILRV
uniref:DDB1- and CUL4-associated factor 7-like n=1 Tax=Sinocyclocheilus rhinocerous TaxID=307959 RepID=A0A673NNR0_9TELE